jgi:hypothetical protein
MKNVIAAAMIAAVGASASASVLYSTSFENPFVVGALPGQQGWAPSGAGASGLFGVNATPGFARTGSQFVAFNSANMSSAGSRWSWIDNTQTGLAGSGQAIIRASAHVAVLNNATAAVGRETAAGLDLYDDSGFNRIGAVRIRNTGQVDFINGLNQVASLGPGAVTANAYNKVEVSANFDTQTVEYRINGILITGFAAGFLNFTGTGFGDADLYAVRINTATTNSGGHTALYDDLLIERIPAPGAVSVLGLAGLVAARRRRA